MKRKVTRKTRSNDTKRTLTECKGLLELVECQENGIRTRPRIYLRGPKVTFGRALDSIVQLDSSQISRNHCVMEFSKKKWKIKDTSLNGIAVNGQKLPSNEFVILKNGDVISFVRASPILKYTYFEDKNRPLQSKVDVFNSVPLNSSSPNSSHNNTFEIGENLSTIVNFSTRNKSKSKEPTALLEKNEESKFKADVSTVPNNTELQTNCIQQSPVIGNQKSILSDSTKLQPLKEISVEDIPIRKREIDRKRKLEEDAVKICKIPKLVYSQNEQTSDVDRILNKDDTELRQQSNSNSEVVSQNKKQLDITHLEERLNIQNNILDEPAISEQQVKLINEPSKNDRISQKRPSAQFGPAFYQNRFFLPPLLFGKNGNEVKKELDKVSHDKPTSLSGKLHLDKEKDIISEPVKTLDPKPVENVQKNQERVNEIWLNILNKRLETLKREREEKEREEQRKSEMNLQQQQMNKNGPRRSNRVSKPPERFGSVKLPLQSVLRDSTRTSRSAKEKEQRHEALEISNPSFRAKLQRLNRDKGIGSSSQPETYLWKRKDWSQRRTQARLEFSRRSALSTANTIKKYLDNLPE